VGSWLYGSQVFAPGQPSGELMGGWPEGWVHGWGIDFLVFGCHVEFVFEIGRPSIHPSLSLSLSILVHFFRCTLPVYPLID